MKDFIPITLWYFMSLIGTRLEWDENDLKVEDVTKKRRKKGLEEHQSGTPNVIFLEWQSTMAYVR